MRGGGVRIAGQSVPAGGDSVLGKIRAFAAAGGKLSQVETGPGELPGSLDIVGLMLVARLCVPIRLLRGGGEGAPGPRPGPRARSHGRKKAEANREEKGRPGSSQKSLRPSPGNEAAQYRRISYC